MAKYDSHRVGSEINWMGEIIQAFNCRFDDQGNENPQAPDRIHEMHQAIEYWYGYVRETFTFVNCDEMLQAMGLFNRKLIETIELNRNLSEDEVVELLEFYSDAVTKCRVGIEQL